MAGSIEYGVMNYLGNVIAITSSLEEAESIRDSNQEIANRVGDSHYNYHVVKRTVYVGDWCEA